MSREDLSDTLRILVATDCHLGYMEKDEIRRHDSFKAFQEICSIAEDKQVLIFFILSLATIFISSSFPHYFKQVDFLLLGGDLFHENKPSRTTLVKAIEILRRHCLNDKPVQFQVVSDQTVNFQNAFGHVNYEDPHFNVGLPVFSIHGNHDDPAGVDNLSAIDILSACNLVNYFGKMNLGGSGVGQISLYPILMRKGSTTVALYGLGNIRDERLNRMFQTPHAVQWMRPEVQEGCDVSDWFNILVLHQNRVKSNPKNAISEHFLPRFLDFIVWGHEHECLIDPQEVSGMGFHITQPGSSVATSLIDGESKPKHVLLLEIKGNQYRPTKIPLTSVRPFEYTEIVLKDEDDIDPNDQNSILEHLDKVVRDLIEKASKKAVNRSDIQLPLVRIKVDYSGFMTINPQRFGQKYVGKVANPQDILIFSKASKKGQREGTIDDSERLRPEELNQQNIEALVAESNLKMEILPVNDLDVALQNFVNKDDKLAFYSCVQYNLQETRGKLAKDSDAQKFEEDDLILKVGECLEERLKDRSTRPSGSSQFLSTGLTSENLTKRSSGIANASFSDDEDTTQISGSVPATRGRRGSSTGTSRGRAKAPTRGRGRGKASSAMKQTTLDGSLGLRQSQRSASASFKSASTIVEDDVDSPSSEEAEPEDLNQVDSSSEEEENTRGKGRKRQATTKRGRGRGTVTSKRGRKNESSSSLHRLLSSKDEDEDEDDEDIEKKLNRSQPRVTRNYGALRR
ncbi:PREDICTED: double-strand break repair protein MRE11 isoform X1 [Brassica oleracea var. oleracea]|uniref:double-strand break repair protein MRE11 isoform X1 n=1 Tax=Brassica oleracea var. oleracea TaxID=109376 RepID=UPI0006A712D4|nr:PREDICTED: double-strand break repair protein MRE11 isoform X1 [Brassica oleracea var. oleracea]